MTSIFEERVQKLLSMLRLLAQCDQPAPDDHRIAQHLGISEQFVPTVLTDAVRQRQLRILYLDSQRVFELPDEALRTAAGPLPLAISANVPRLVKYIRARALAGESAPTNQDICDYFGFASRSSAAKLVQEAEQQGLIRVHRGQTARVIQAADGTWRTAGHMPALHWRARARQECAA